MPDVITPGTYLRLRREADGKTLDDLARQIRTEPTWNEHFRTEWLALIEADAMPARGATVDVLLKLYRFDPSVLARLADIKDGFAIEPPEICRQCACSWYDACRVPEGGCHWGDADLCSGCQSDAQTAPASDKRRAA